MKSLLSRQAHLLTVMDKGGLVELQCKKTIGIRALIRHLMAVMFNLRVNLIIIVIFDFVAFRHRSKQFFLLGQANVQEIASKTAQVCGKSIFSIYRFACQYLYHVFLWSWGAKCSISTILNSDV